MDNRRMCPNCRAFITTSDRTCPYCGQPVGQRAIDVRQPKDILGGLIPHAYFTTIVILLINFGMYIGQTQFGNGDLTFAGEKNAAAIFQGHQYWRLITAGFLHGNLLHILMNSWVLYDLGAQVEQLYGTSRFLVAYFVSTITGFLLSCVVNPLVPSLGASAGIMGLVGAMIAFGVVNRSSVGRAIRNAYIRYVVYMIAFGLIVRFVDNAAHIGGLAGGFAVGYVAGTPIRATAPRETIWRGLAIACVLLTVLSFFMVYRNFPAPDQLR